MIDLTGANLVAYLRRIIRDVASRNPRFRNTLGEVTFTANRINFSDAQITISRISASGNRLSPDYFMCTQHGQAIVAKVGDKEGSFVEWAMEVDRNRTILDPGVYYLKVHTVNEATREVAIDMHKYKWREGKISQATGSKIFFAPGIDPAQQVYLDVTDPDNPVALQSGDLLFPIGTNYAVLLKPVTALRVQGRLPLTEYWILRTVSTEICSGTLNGQQDITIPTDFESISFKDQDDYELREDVDYTFVELNKIRLSAWTPEGSKIFAVTSKKLDPATTNPIHPENYLGIVLGEGETIAPGQVFIQSSAGDVTNVALQPDGSFVLPTLLAPNDWARYEVRIDCGVTLDVSTKKMELNDNLVPGLWVAIGDMVVPEDEVAIIVSPTLTETYEIFGSKENLNFTLEVKANDFTTASDISELLKRELLVFRRDNMEADGVTIFEVSREFEGEQRDPSATSTRYVYSLSVTAMADWKVFVPLVTRLVSIEVDNLTNNIDFPGKLRVEKRLQAMGAFSFIPSYA